MSKYTFYKRQDEERDVVIGILLWIFSLFLGLVLGSASANAQMANEPWTFKQQNRASIAALMQQVENRNGTTAATAAAAPGGLDTLICGGDGASAATGNSTCIILNNSNGAIEIGQDAQGNQDANNSQNTAVNSLSETLNDLE